MRDDAEIAGQLDRHKALHYAGAAMVGQSGGTYSPRLKVGLCAKRVVFPLPPVLNEVMPRLSIRAESGEQIFHELVDESFTIGRSPENSIRLEDVSVSGRHAELILVGESCYLKDLGSTNGTLVNGEPVTGVHLRAGDQIRFGKVEARYEADLVGDAQPLPQLEEVEARPAESSARPADFANASPFPNRKKEQDATRTAILAAAALAFLAFIASMIAVSMIHGPVP
jgi:pSer/pThr/pTyr-binding forkhead associated (FHA) protein